jgi:hypothetical protein
MNFKTFKMVRGFWKQNTTKWNLPEGFRNYLISRLIDGEFVTENNSDRPKFLMRLDALDAIVAEVQCVERARVINLVWDAKKSGIKSVEELHILVEVNS